MDGMYRSATAVLVSIAMWGLLAVGDAGLHTGKAASDSTSPFQDRSERLRALDTRITSLKNALEQNRKDLGDYSAIVQVWDEMRKQFQAYQGAANYGLGKCGEHNEEIKKLQKTHPELAKRFMVTIDECRDVIKTTDRLIADYELAFVRIASQIEIIKTLTNVTAKSSETNESLLKVREEEKRVIDNLKKLPGMSGYSGAITPESFKGY